MAATLVTVTFAGLMIFRRDRQADLYDLGILPARNLASIGLPGIPDHVFRITIKPDPNTGTGKLEIDEQQLAEYASEGNTWFLDVVGPNGDSRKRVLSRN